MRNILLLILVSCFTAQIAIGQKVSTRPNAAAIDSKPTSALSAIQLQLKKSIEKVTPACVQVITNEPLGGSPTGMGASGVCVSKDGIIMTAGHMVIPNRKYEIIFPDGKKVTANGLGKIGKLDAGLLKISAEGNYPFAEMGFSSTLEKGEICFSLSYPGSFRNRMVARMGFIEKVSTDIEGDVRSNYILNTCTMEPGDSGGALFDIYGRVIGIRSYIGRLPEENYDAPIDVFRRFWSSLKVPENYSSNPVENSDFLKPVTNTTQPVIWKDILYAIKEQFQYLNQYCINISSGGKSILGTIVSLEGVLSRRDVTKNTFVISKSSEVGENPKVTIDGKPIAADILFRNSRLDLVLLEVKHKSHNALRIVENNHGSLTSGSMGSLLISPLPDGIPEISIAGTNPFNLPGYYYTGYLGLRIEWNGENNIVTTVQPGTPAENAGIRSGDIIKQIDKVPITRPSNFTDELENKKPGDTIMVIRIQHEATDTLHIILKARPFQGINHISDQFPGGRSGRRDGFDQVFVHSADIKPSACGGPVFDLSGDFAGINIARYSRVGSLTIPKEEIKKFLIEGYSKY